MNEKLPDNRFREGDLRFDPIARKIEEIVYFAGDVPYRYIVDGYKSASFAEWELVKARNQNEVQEVKAILDKRYNRREKQYYYKIQLRGETKRKAGWYSHEDIVNDIGLRMLNKFLRIYEDNKK